MTERETVLIYGRHAVGEALSNHKDRVRMVYFKSDDDAETRQTIKATGVAVGSYSPQLEWQLRDVNHQGIAAQVEMPPLISLDLFFRDNPPSPDSALLLFAEVQDPHNVGAIIRSAAAFGISGILMPEHRQAGLSPTVAKVSSGMLFTIPLISIGNINQTIDKLKENGYWIYGLAGEGTNMLYKEKFDAPAVFVIGGEGEGLREKTREHCDILLKIPMHPRCESLNASNAAAVVFSHWSAQHPKALK